jgi:hypothetical protein
MPEEYNMSPNPEIVRRLACFSLKSFSPVTISQDTGVPNTNLSSQVAPSTGPQRSGRSAKGKGKEIDKDKGKRQRTPKKDLTPDINWPNTCERFCAEMAKIYFDQPTGEVLNPEMAYAEVNKFIKEDLYLSVSGFFYCDCRSSLNKSVHPVTATRGEAFGRATKSGLRAVPDRHSQ